MKIQVNTDHNTPGSQSLNDFIDTVLKSELDHFSDHITRIEVHLSDENAGKVSENDKRCMVEVRIEHRQPVAVTAHANTYEESISDATDKMKSALDTVFGKLNNH
jgi:ribosome-associated translation inhibitor RaiA